MSYRGKAKGNYGNKRHRRNSALAKSNPRSKQDSSKTCNDFTSFAAHKPDWSNSLTQPEETVISYALDTVFNQVPIISELHTAYVLADSIYDNWNSITQLYDVYQKKGWDGVAESIGTDIVRDALSSVQTNLVWLAICKLIPTPIQNESKEVLSGIIDKVTSAEVNFVTEFLTEQKTKKVSLTRPKQKYSSKLYKQQMENPG